jgi:ankyrin repeat protein
METEPQWYELRDSVYSRRLGRAEELLQSNPKLLTLMNSIGETVLHYLAVENDIEGVAWLHDRGFSLNTRSELGTPMVFEVADLGYKDLLLWLSQNGADFSALDEENRGIFENLLDGLDQELQDPTTEERAIKYWRQHAETIRFLKENISYISMSEEQLTLFSALSARAAQ